MTGRKTIVISGGTSSGTTTLLNALLKEIPERERLVVIEDTPERAIDQIALMALLSGLDLGWAATRTYVEQVIDVVVQLERSPFGRRVSEIKFRGR